MKKRSTVYVRDTKSFIEVSTVIHSGKYDYSVTVYRGAHAKLTVICPDHGPFEQLATHHRQGRGCPACGGVDPSTPEKFEKKARLVHGEKYDYSKVVISHSHDKVLITCPEHGDFIQRANSHLSGSGCQICAEALSRVGLEKGRKTLASTR